MSSSLVRSVLRSGAAAALVLVPVVGLTSTASAASQSALVTVVHGIPNTPVDVYVDGAKALPDFKFKTVTGPITLPAGSHKIQVRKAGAAKSSAPILATSVTLTSGENATIVANLKANGDPTLTAFVNPTTAVPDSMGRLIVRHTAAAPAVDVLAGTTPGDQEPHQPPQQVADGPRRHGQGSSRRPAPPSR